MKLSHNFLIVVSLALYSPTSSGNTTSENKTDAMNNRECGVFNRVSCGPEKVCQDGVCVSVNRSTTKGKSRNSATETTYKVIMETKELGPSTTQSAHPVTRLVTSTTSHSLITGNQEFLIAVVGFSLLFMNFCLISFCWARIKRRRLLQQLEVERYQAARQSSQASQTGDWNFGNANRREMGLDNFALNGELDAFPSDFITPQVRLPPYDFTGAYHKPRPITEESIINGESCAQTETIDSDEFNDDDPPPYNDTEALSTPSSPPSYDDTLTFPTSAPGE